MNNLVMGLGRLSVVVLCASFYLAVRDAILFASSGPPEVSIKWVLASLRPIDNTDWWATWFLAIPTTIIAALIFGGMFTCVLWILKGFVGEKS